MVWLLLAVTFLFLTFLATYEWVAKSTGKFPVITSEVRGSERRYAPVWFGGFLALGVLLGHFWN